MTENNEKKSTMKSSSKKKKTIVNGTVHVFASFNNTIISISDSNGNILCWSSAGKHGFKGSRKATPYAAQVATQHVINIAKEYGLQNALVEIKGPGVGREASLRAIQAAGLNVTLIKDITYHPHNGCRPAKRRRV
jgi:small subunit ribosomal protein S11